MPKRKKLTWKTHKKQWSDCTRCNLCEHRKKVVLLRGKIPCDILFVTEAPGQSDEVLGKPLSGPAGHLLNKMIQDALGDEFRMAFTNLVGCIPKDENGNSIKEPPQDAIKACGKRISEIVQLTKPEVIVSVGKLPKKYIGKILNLDPLHEIPIVQIIHPTGILKADISQRGLAFQRNVIAIRDAADKIIPF